MFCHLLFITGGSKSVESLEAQCSQLCNGQTRDHALPEYSVHLEAPGQWRGPLVTPKRAHLHHAIPTSFELSPPLPAHRSSQQEALVSCDHEALPCEGKLCFGHGHLPVLTGSGDSGWGGAGHPVSRKTLRGGQGLLRPQAAQANAAAGALPQGLSRGL